MNKKEVLDKIRGLDKGTQKRMVCALVGHSRIIITCFGYIHCGRCEAQIGDSLGGCYRAKDDVIIGHNCSTCRENYKKLTWEDKLLAPTPKDIFTKEAQDVRKTQTPT